MIDKEFLSEMEGTFREIKKPVVLFPFNEYCKYMVNRYHDDILYIIDDKKGWKYRGIDILEDISGDPGSFFCCSIQFNNELVGRIKSSERYKKQRIYFFPKTDKYKKDKDPFHNIRFYYELKREMEYRGIVSMLDHNKIFTLLEMLKACRGLGGKICEYGVWLGGSAFAIGKALKYLNIDKELFLIDLFELLDAKSDHAIMCLDEIKYLMSFYNKCRFFQTDLEKNIDLIKDESFSFIHYDAPFNEKVLENLYDSLLKGGIMVIDNYNNTIGNFALFDKWFRKNSPNTPIFSPGNINQGIFFKN